jgi:Anti-sigma-K factor rskA
MARELSHQELEDLLGAYALDAVDGDELEQVEEYLEHDSAARARVAQYREATALLAQPDVEAPLDLWRRIEDSLEARQPDKGSAVVAIETRRSRSRRRLATAIAAAAAAVLIAVLGVKLVQQDDRIDDLAGRVDGGGGVLAAARNALSDPQAERISLASSDGRLEARIVYLPDGEGYVLDDNLSELTPDRTYQLWALVGDRRAPKAISAGVLGSDPGVTAFKVNSPVVGFAITDEAAPGVTAPEQPPLLQGDVS